MQQLIKITGITSYAVTKGVSLLPFQVPCLARRREDPESLGNHILRIDGGVDYKEKYLSWTGVARDVVTVPDDAVLSDWGQYLPRDGEITGAWVGQKPTEREGEDVADDQWILYAVDAGWQPVCRNPWVVIDRDNNYIFEIPPLMSERDAKGIGNLLCTAPQLYTALKLALAELNEYTNGIDETHVPSLFHAIRTANAALAKAVGKGGGNE